MNRAEDFKELVAQYSSVPAAEMTDDMSLREDLGLSSLDFMTFLGEIEDTFDVELDLDRAVQVRTIGEALDMLEELVEA
ncbi:acyl carrier protein [Lachnospiraceae bacterium NE2001]|nr:acyl carrier protein [Lachnospiraceae bacterium NE2001]